MCIFPYSFSFFCRFKKNSIIEINSNIQSSDSVWSLCGHNQSPIRGNVREISKNWHTNGHFVSCHHLSNQIRLSLIQFKTITLCCVSDIFVCRSLSRRIRRGKKTKNIISFTNENIPKNSYIFFCDNNNWVLFTFS